MGQKHRLFSKQKVAEFFLKEKQVYETGRAVNLKKVAWCLGAVVLAGMFTVIALPTDTGKPAVSSNPSSGYPKNSPPTGNQDDDRMNPPGGGLAGSRSRFYARGGGTPSRNRNANQVIRRNAQNSDSIGRIPMGSAIGARLLNAVVSGNAASPVIATISPGDGMSEIPPGSKAIGAAKFDENARRMQIAFHTIVYPDGEQHGVQAVAMMPDGSAGLDGDYSSGEGARSVGRFMSTFVGGLAEGLKSREQGGIFSGPYEPGSIRNGVLNGVAQTAGDQAKQYTDSMGNTAASMSLPAGMEFVFYFEQEFSP
jgi:hypothetical protein